MGPPADTTQARGSMSRTRGASLASVAGARRSEEWNPGWLKYLAWASTQRRWATLPLHAAGLRLSTAPADGVATRISPLPKATSLPSTVGHGTPRSSRRRSVCSGGWSDPSVVPPRPTPVSISVAVSRIALGMRSATARMVLASNTPLSSSIAAMLAVALPGAAPNATAAAVTGAAGLSALGGAMRSAKQQPSSSI